MTRTPLALAFTAALLALAPPLAHAQNGGNFQPPGWLAGCWEERAGAHLVEEQWMAPRGGVMLGMGRTTRGDSLVGFEQTRIVARPGGLVFHALPMGQPPAEFSSIAVSDSAVTFENLAHDFPQRVMYRRSGSDSLIARVEGTEAGTVRGVDFPYRRVACP